LTIAYGPLELRKHPLAAFFYNIEHITLLFNHIWHAWQCAFLHCPSLFFILFFWLPFDVFSFLLGVSVSCVSSESNGMLYTFEGYSSGGGRRADGRGVDTHGW
jgi:hypothetical protein